MTTFSQDIRSVYGGHAAYISVNTGHGYGLQVLDEQYQTIALPDHANLGAAFDLLDRCEGEFGPGISQLDGAPTAKSTPLPQDITLLMDELFGHAPALQGLAQHPSPLAAGAL